MLKTIWDPPPLQTPSENLLLIFLFLVEAVHNLRGKMEGVFNFVYYGHFLLLLSTYKATKNTTRIFHSTVSLLFPALSFCVSWGRGERIG